jgi:hypothetical protein
MATIHQIDTSVQCLDVGKWRQRKVARHIGLQETTTGSLVFRPFPECLMNAALPGIFKLVLVQTSHLDGVDADAAHLGILGGENVDLGPLVGRSDEVLVDLKDHALVNNGLFIAQVEERLLVCRANKAHSFWLLSPAESVTPESLIEDYRVLGRIWLIWKRV